MNAPPITSSDSKTDSNLHRVIATLIVPALAVSFSLVHMQQVKTDRVSPWRGGSFGMFSTLSQAYHRLLYISVKVDGKWIPATMKGKWFTDTSGIINARPTTPKLQQLGNELAEFDWLEASTVPRTITPVAKAKPGTPLVKISAIRISVWQAHLAPDSKRFTMKPLVGVEKKITQ